MAMLLFYIRENRFAIDCSSIIRIVPHVSLKKIPQAVPYLLGILLLGGMQIPVIDFCKMIEKCEISPSFHSRIILLKDPQLGSEKSVGLLGERVNEIIALKPEQFIKAPFQIHHFPFLKKGYSDDKGIIELIDLEELFSYLSKAYEFP